MSDNAPLKRIKHKIVIDKTSDGGHRLRNCFFLAADVDGYYNFYDQRGRTLATGLRSGISFPFLLDAIAWTIFKFKIDPIAAQGDWSNNLPSIVEAEDGTFQAQSGGGVPEDDVQDPDDGADNEENASAVTA